MNLRCKSGDLAIIIYDTPECSSNIGRVVEVRGPVEFNSRYWIGAQCWLIKPIHRTLYMAEYETLGERIVIPEICFWKTKLEHPDSWMLPIRPKDEDLDVSDAEDLINSLMRKGFVDKKILLKA